MQPRILLLSSLVLSLVACGGSPAATCTQAYWDGEVGTCLPEGWHVLDRSNLDDRGVPQEAVVAFQTDESIAGQYLTIVVTREDLQQEVATSDYSEAGVASVSTLPGYARVDEQSVTIDGQKHILHIFTAQPSDAQPLARFYQLSMAAGRQGYTFTAATPVSIAKTDEEGILTILTNATLTDPDAADAATTPVEE